MQGLKPSSITLFVGTAGSRALIQTCVVLTLGCYRHELLGCYFHGWQNLWQDLRPLAVPKRYFILNVEGAGAGAVLSGFVGATVIAVVFCGKWHIPSEAPAVCAFPSGAADVIL